MCWRGEGHNGEQQPSTPAPKGSMGLLVQMTNYYFILLFIKLFYLDLDRFIAALPFSYIQCQYTVPSVSLIRIGVSINTLPSGVQSSSGYAET